MDNQTSQFDPQAVAMVRAIKLQESGNNYNAPKESTGQSLGGAYQYQANTWKQYAGHVLGDPNAPFTPENQDKARNDSVSICVSCRFQKYREIISWCPCL